MTEKKAQGPDQQGLAKFRRRYAEFLKNNPESDVFSIEYEGERKFGIREPWGDRSLALMIPDDDAELRKALASVYLPPRYTALYHLKDEALEIIWTAWKLDDEQAEIENRRFDIELPFGTYNCHFRNSSPELLTIAGAALPLEISATGFRNLVSFARYKAKDEAEQDDTETVGFGNPLSFWIEKLPWDDEKVIQLIRHVNFFLKYYDVKSPTIEIHSSTDQEDVQRNRYFEGFGFPNKIVSPSLDRNLLILYDSAIRGAVSTSFLNLFRIIEYVAFDYSQDGVRGEIKKIIESPHALHSVEKTATNLMLLLKEFKYEDSQKVIPTFLRSVIEPARLWAELEPNRTCFEKDTEFEGGLVIPALFNANCCAEKFGPTEVEQFSRLCIKIRNSLAHGRDKQSADSVLPTARNFNLLKPWLNGLAACAGEVVVYSGHH